MTVPFLRENFFIHQGEDFRKSFPFPDANDDYTVYAEIRRYAGGPSLPGVPPFSASCDAGTQTLTISLASEFTSLIKRTNVAFDIFVNDGAELHPFRSGLVGLVPRVSQTASEPAYRTWGMLEFTPGLTWAELENNFETWDALA